MSNPATISKIKIDPLQMLIDHQVKAEYESETDTFLLWLAQIRHEDLIVTHYIGQFFLILFRHPDGQIVGIGVEGCCYLFGMCPDKG